MTTLIIGGTGNSGKPVVEGLLAAKVPVRLLVRDPEKVKHYTNAEIVKGDLNDPASLEKAFKGVKHVFLVTPFQEDQETPATNAINKAKEAGVEFIVKVSAIGANTGSPLRVGAEHGRIEEKIEKSGIKYTLLQPTFFFQNFLGSAATIKSQGAVYGSAGEGKTAALDAEDIGRVAVAVLLDPQKHANKKYELTGSQLLTSAEEVKIIGDAIGKELKYVDIPAENFNEALVKAGLPSWAATDIVALAGIRKANYTNRQSHSIKEITGKDPVTLADWAKRHKAAFV